MSSLEIPNVPLSAIQIDLVQAMCLIGQIQLASRHHANVGPSAIIAQGFARMLQREVHSIAPEYTEMLEMGWDPEKDC